MTLSLINTKSVFAMTEPEFVTHLSRKQKLSPLAGRSFCPFGGTKLNLPPFSKGRSGGIRCPECDIERTTVKGKFPLHFPMARRGSSPIRSRRFCSYSETSQHHRATRLRKCPTCGLEKKPVRKGGTNIFPRHFPPAGSGYTDPTDIRAHLRILDGSKASSIKYADANTTEFPLLTYFGKASIAPEWILDRRSGEIRIAGEFQDIPAYFLDLSSRPSKEQLIRSGNRKSGGLDVLVDQINQLFGLQLGDSEDLRQKLIAEIDRYERSDAA